MGWGKRYHMHFGKRAFERDLVQEVIGADDEVRQSRY